MQTPEAVTRKIDELKEVLGEIEMGVVTEGYTLATALREGSLVTKKSVGWSDESGNCICALASIWLAAETRGIVE